MMIVGSVVCHLGVCDRHGVCQHWSAEHAGERRITAKSEVYSRALSLTYISGPRNKRGGCPLPRYLFDVKSDSRAGLVG